MKTNIIKAINDPNLFRTFVTGDPEGDLATWKNWLTFLKVLHGLRVHKAEQKLVQRCTGRDASRLPRGGFQECLLLAGRRSGKSKTIALCGAFEAILSGLELGLSPGEIPMVSILSPTRFQSRIIHSYLRGVFDSTPLLQNEVIEQKRDGFVLRNGVEIAVLAGCPKVVRGFSNIACIIDEVAMFGLSEESKVRSDLELVRALRPSLASTGGRLLCVGTPFAAKGFAYKTWKKSYGNDTSDVLCWNAPSTLMNPTLDEGIVQRAIDDDPIAAEVEYCVRVGLFREDIDDFVSRAAVEALVIRGRDELPPRSGVSYAAFADVSGGRHDDAALAIAHREDRTIVLDCLQRFRSPHNPYEIVARMCATIRRYGCKKAIGDAYAAEWSRTAFRSHGIDYLRATSSVWKTGAAAVKKVAKPKSVLYSELLSKIHSGEIELLDNEVLISQLAGLQRRTRSGGRDTIDHAPGAFDDLANCVAGVCDAVMQRKIVLGSMLSDSHAGLSDFARAQRRHEEYQSEMEALASAGNDPGGREERIRAMRQIGRHR